jgi:hypothetical protein
MAEPASGAAAVECAENENKSLDVPPALSTLKFYAGDRNFIVFESYLNAKPGSRNLEFDPQKTVKVR